MTQKEFIRQICIDTGLSKEIVNKVFNSSIDTLKDNIRQGIDIKIKDFATFKKEVRKEQVRRNPKTGESVTVPKHYYLKINISKVFKDELKEQVCYG